MFKTSKNLMTSVVDNSEKLDANSTSKNWQTYERVHILNTNLN